MQNFFNKVGKTASEAAAKAGSKASELMEIGKLKGKISAKKRRSNLWKPRSKRSRRNIASNTTKKILLQKNRLQDSIWGRTGFDGGVETGGASRSLSSLR